MFTAEVMKITVFGNKDYEEQTFATRPEAEEWINKHEPFGYTNPQINGEPVAFTSDGVPYLQARLKLSELHDNRLELFRANANRNSLRLLKPSNPDECTDILYAEEDKSCA